MSPPQPVGESAPADGQLPDHAMSGLITKPFGVYVHVPFCAARCGYCDFNTYTADQLQGSSTADYVAAAHAEIRFTSSVIVDAPPMDTVFFGGGTPTLLNVDDQVGLLDHLTANFGCTSDAEVTTEANPESVDAPSLSKLRDGGFNRLSLGMQSAVPHVLRTLDRTHTPGKVAASVVAARAAGFHNISLDLIYGAPGESLDDWRQSLRAAIELQPEHISAYALIVEDGTRLSRQIRDGEVAGPDDDAQAEKYALADQTLKSAGFEWYEISNWSRDVQTRCRHNLGYWSGSNWWGIGPGAHSHISGVRWWNVKHPRAYASRMKAEESPAAGREVLDESTQWVEQVMLGIRCRDGVPRELLTVEAEQAAQLLVADELLTRSDWESGRAVLTERGRLLADLVVRTMTA